MSGGVSRGMSGGASAASPKPAAIVLLAAVADNGVIGRDNALPFRQSSDLKRFKAITMGKPIVMGRKTYQSIGKPLPGRTNIVMSRDPGFAPAGVLVAANLDSALDLARADAEKRGAGEIVVIGGTGLFEQTMPLAERMEITHVHARPDGDIHFPPIDAAKWRAVARSDHPAGPQDEASFSYVTYARA
jgi:dihydrofolate reductase